MATNVLLVEDDANIQKIVGFMLKATGYDLVAVCSTGGLSVEYCKEAQPDVIVLDYCLPDTDGLQLLARLRELGVTAPIIMYSAYHDDYRVMRCIKSGASAFVLKCSDPMSLVHALDAVSNGADFWLDREIRMSLLERCTTALQS